MKGTEPMESNVTSMPRAATSRRHSRVPVVSLVGPPTAGKSTALGAVRQAVPGLVHFGVRVYFGQQAEAGTEIGLQAKEYAQRGRWLPDEFVGKGLAAWLEEQLPAVQGIVIEGFPRNRSQAQVLDEVLARFGLALDSFIYLNVPDDVAADRVTLRQVCQSCDTFVEDGIPVPDATCDRCGGPLVLRRDDAPEVFRERLAHHREAVEDLLGHYQPRGIVARIDGTASRQQVAAELRALLTR
ncbi:nucleoside monophosphate kinase [Streptomyces sp. NPDC046994]|uniref:adenylate kinase family protein n=1 Tax=Streptomyces sp. NPDC046994 TaxID=3155735 RepID=UPI003456EC24